MAGPSIAAEDAARPPRRRRRPRRARRRRPPRCRRRGRPRGRPDSSRRPRTELAGYAGCGAPAPPSFPAPGPRLVPEHGAPRHTESVAGALACRATSQGEYDGVASGKKADRARPSNGAPCERHLLGDDPRSPRRRNSRSDVPSPGTRAGQGLAGLQGPGTEILRLGPPSPGPVLYVTCVNDASARPPGESGGRRGERPSSRWPSDRRQRAAGGACSSSRRSSASPRQRLVPRWRCVHDDGAVLSEPWLLLRPLAAAEDLGELGQLVGVQAHGWCSRARGAAIGAESGCGKTSTTSARTEIGRRARCSST